MIWVEQWQKEMIMHKYYNKSCANVTTSFKRIVFQEVKSISVKTICIKYS